MQNSDNLIIEQVGDGQPSAESDSRDKGARRPKSGKSLREQPAKETLFCRISDEKIIIIYEILSFNQQFRCFATVPVSLP